MLNVSEAYKAAITKPDRVFKSRISINGDLIEDDYIASIGYSSAIISDDDFEIGTAIMASTDIQLIDKDYSLNYSFEDEELKVEIGLTLQDGSIEYIPLGLFTVDNCKKDFRKIKISASDRMHKFEKPYVSNLVYPATLLQIAKDICDIAGVELLNTSFSNYDYIVGSEPVFDNVTCRTAIAAIAELAGGYTRITRDGKLEIFNINTTIRNTENYASNDDFLSSGGFFIADELIAGVINVNENNLITLTNKNLNLSMIDKVVVKVGSVEASRGDGENPYYIVDNLFCQNPDNVVDNLYNVLNGISYMPFNAKWQGNMAIDCGDMITLNTEKGYYNTIATSRKLTYSGGLREEYVAVGKSNTEKISTPKGSLTIEMENKKVEIKVLKNGIEQRVTKEDFETYVLQTAEEIKQKVSKGDDLKSEVTQNAESWKLSINGKLKGTKYEFDGTSFKIGDTNSGDAAEHAPNYSKWKHSDGTYTQVDANGFKHYNGMTSEEYHYLTSRIEYADVFNGKTTVQLPDEFKNKKFSASLSITKVTAVGDQFFVRYWDAYIDDESIDYVNATFDVWTQVRAADLYNDPTTNRISSLDNGNGIMNFTVTAIA